MITLNVEPNIVKTLNRFMKENPPYSVALDGYVKDKSKIIVAEKGPYANFDHHYYVNRLDTRCTARQIYDRIKLRSFKDFVKNGELTFNLYVNDCDQDVCSTVWFFYNQNKINEDRGSPLITRFIGVIDLLDSFCGFYPFPRDSEILNEIGWIFEIYTNARFEERLDKMSAEEKKELIMNTLTRISYYVDGRGEKIEINDDYERIGGNKNWIMLKELGSHVRGRIFREGYDLFVSVRERENSRFSYSIIKVIPNDDISFKELSEELNKADHFSELGLEKWYHSDMILAPPRDIGSGIVPTSLEKILNNALEKI